MTNDLVLDVGNSNISYYCGGFHGAISTFLDAKTCEFVIKSFKTTSITFASVVPNVSALIFHVAQMLSIKCHEVLISDVKMSVSIDNPSELGIDRLINAFIGMQEFGQNVVVIDFGTALTYDIVYQGVYEGGMIFPGLSVAMYNLHLNTAKLPHVNVHQYLAGIGKNTYNAIHFGACIGYIGAIKETVSFINEAYRSNFKIVLTGGSGKMFSDAISESTYKTNMVIDYLLQYITD